MRGSQGGGGEAARGGEASKRGGGEAGRRGGEGAKASRQAGESTAWGRVETRLSDLWGIIHHLG